MTSGVEGQKRVPWPFIRLVGVLVVILVGGMIGFVPGVRVAGGLMILYAAIQAVTHLTGRSSSREDTAQLPLGAVLAVAAVQMGVGIFLLGWPGVVLRMLGVEGM